MVEAVREGEEKWLSGSKIHSFYSDFLMYKYSLMYVFFFVYTYFDLLFF